MVLWSDTLRTIAIFDCNPFSGVVEKLTKDSDIMKKNNPGKNLKAFIRQERIDRKNKKGFISSGHWTMQGKSTIVWYCDDCADVFTLPHKHEYYSVG